MAGKSRRGKRGIDSFVDTNKQSITDRSGGLPNYKCIRAHDDAISAAIIGPTSIQLTAASSSPGSKPIGIGVHADKGIVLRGPITLCGPGEIRTNAAWTFNPLQLSCIPSSAASPLSVLRFDPPFQGLKRAAGAVKDFFALAASAAGNAA